MENNNEQKTNTDPKPHIFYFNGDFDTMVQVFFKKIKPIEGIVKYKMVNWEKFPDTLNEAQILGFEWGKKFQLNKLYSEFRVRIYFHIVSKTIRFELKSKNLIVELQSTDTVEEILSKFNYISNKSIKFVCEKNNYFENFDLEMCKTRAIELAEKLEQIYSPNKFVVFLNQNKKSIYITMK